MPHPFAHFAKGRDSTNERRILASLRKGIVSAVLLTCLLRSRRAASAQTTPSADHHHPQEKEKSHKKVSSRRGQQKIDTPRAREIQEALIREHYLTGKASGVWDDASQKAMQKYQADHGWQSKTTPDSRALIKLGLGPDHEHLLNPQSAMTSAPPQPAAAADPGKPRQ